MEYVHFIGVDVSKNWLDVSTHGTRNGTKEGGKESVASRYPNSGEGVASFVAELAERKGKSLVVLEATGGYESALITALMAKQIAVHRACPLSAKHFIRSVKLRGKTDALDAAALARYGAERHAELALCQPTETEQTRLQSLVMRRNDLVRMRAGETTRAKHPNYAGLQASLGKILAALTREITDIEEEISALIARVEPLKARRDVLTEVPGIGVQTATVLLATMPELGTLSRRQAASLAGVAPHPRDSGTRNGYRATGGGRRNVKCALFMAAMAARNHHPTLKEFYEKLIQNGKKPMVALTATMRKLITILNAKIRDKIYATT